MRVPTLLLQLKQHRQITLDGPQPHANRQHGVHWRAFHSMRWQWTSGFLQHGKDHAGDHPAEDVEDAESPGMNFYLASCLP